MRHIVCTLLILTGAALAGCSTDEVKRSGPTVSSPQPQAIAAGSGSSAKDASQTTSAEQSKVAQKGQRHSSDDDMVVIKGSAAAQKMNTSEQELGLVAGCLPDNYNGPSKVTEGEESPQGCGLPSEENEQK